MEKKNTEGRKFFYMFVNYVQQRDSHYKFYLQSEKNWNYCLQLWISYKKFLSLVYLREEGTYIWNRLEIVKRWRWRKRMKERSDMTDFSFFIVADGI